MTNRGENLARPMKPAAILARISTLGQGEPSLDSQVTAARAVLEAQGYTVAPEHAIKIDWTSLDLMACPPFQQLRRWIVNGEIKAVGMLDRDRLQAQGLQRLVFMSECKENNVQVIVAQGVPLMDGPEGQLVELALALGKEKSVLRAQEGSKLGLRDRALLRGLPTSGKAPYGFKFRYREADGTSTPVALEPDPSTYHIAVRIWRMAQDGVSMRRIALDLAQAGILAPKGGKLWNPSTIHRILGNPAYAGRYAALRQEMISPQNRRKVGSYGKSSSRQLPRDNWHFLTDFPVESPIVSWTEWGLVQQQLERNRANATRNGTRFYLIRGMLFCSEDGRRLCGHGLKGRESYVYECPGRRSRVGVPRCGCPRVSGSRVESQVWEEISGFLSDPETFMAELNRHRQSGTDQRIDRKAKVGALEGKLADVVRRESELANLRIRGALSDEALDQSAALLRAERSHYLDEVERQKAAIATVEHTQAAIDSMAALTGRICSRLGSASPEERRWVLEALDTKVMVSEDGDLDISIGVPQQADCVHSPQGQ